MKTQLVRYLSVCCTSLIALAACLAARAEQEKPAAKAVELRDLNLLKEAFNKDVGTPRLILLLSPT